MNKNSGLPNPINNQTNNQIGVDGLTYDPEFFEQLNNDEKVRYLEKLKTTTKNLDEKINYLQNSNLLQM